MKLGYKHTFIACYIGSFLQAAICGFLPLLFVILNRDYNIPLASITVLVTVNFVTQLLTDIFSAFFVERIGYRASIAIAEAVQVMGFFILGAVAPFAENIYTWLMVSVILYSIGGGLQEVVLSPIAEGCPSENKAATLSLLHSMFGIGSVIVILFTTLVLKVFGDESWKYVALLWSGTALFNLVYFLLVPINKPLSKSERMSIASLVRDSRFWAFMLIMSCGGAAEIGLSQWASAFAEESLGVSKTIGDILGPCTFAAMMAASRIMYSRFAHIINLEKAIIICGILTCGCYLAAALVPVSFVALLACGFCGFTVGILWPGCLSLASRTFVSGGAAIFAFMAIAGDVGCTLGPSLVGFVSSAFDGNLKVGIAAGTVFPLILTVGMYLQSRKNK